MSRLGKIILPVILSTALTGCFAPILGYTLVKQETVIDPASGDVTRISYWRYEDGHETTTATTIPKGQVEQRRNERPPTRFGPAPD